MVEALYQCLSYVDVHAAVINLDKQIRENINVDSTYLAAPDWRIHLRPLGSSAAEPGGTVFDQHD
jgi:hypothetical protein